MIGAMVMVGVRGAAPGDDDLEADLAICEEARVGGVILFDVDLPTMTRLKASGMNDADARRAATRNIRSPEQTRELTRYLRSRLGDHLIIAIDHEGGLTTRLSPARGFAATRSAADWADLQPHEQESEAALLADMARDIGATLNFAPCVDLARRADNPIIAQRRRSYGAEAEFVAACAERVIRAHRERGVMACLKHFPGHGASAIDSHVDLPHIDPDAMQRELAVYRAVLPRLGASTWVMTGHLMQPKVDPHAPASLSRVHTTGVLRGQLHYQGVIVTDSLDMGAVTRRWSLADAVVMAINAGADVVLDGVNAPGAPRANPALEMVDAIERAARGGRIEGGTARIKGGVSRIHNSIASIRPSPRRE